MRKALLVVSALALAACNTTVSKEEMSSVDYGPAPTRGRLGGHEFNPPSRVDRRFRRDLEELLRRFRKYGLQLIPSLISFEFCSDKIAGTGPQEGVGYGGRADAIKGKTQIENGALKNPVFEWEDIDQ